VCHTSRTRIFPFNIGLPLSQDQHSLKVDLFVYYIMEYVNVRKTFVGRSV
jgi:hypothetical protein